MLDIADCRLHHGTRFSQGCVVFGDFVSPLIPARSRVSGEKLQVRARIASFDEPVEFIGFPRVLTLRAVFDII